jgi:ornithine decarboxylase
MTERIQEFLRSRRNEGQDVEPCLVVDLEVVRDNYQTFSKALPDSRVFYAVKANPAPEVLSLLASMGSCFDCASVQEIQMALDAGATPERVSYGNTIKKERDIARAFALGIRLFSVDCTAEVEKIARAAPGAKVFCRILYDCAGAEWPLSRKFGCDPEMAVDVLELAKRLGLEPYGISFHVGSQQRKVKAWDRALSMASSVFRDCAERGINLSMVNMGGGFPNLRGEPHRASLEPARRRRSRALQEAQGTPGHHLAGRDGRPGQRGARLRGRGVSRRHQPAACEVSHARGRRRAGPGGQRGRWACRPCQPLFLPQRNPFGV